MQLSAEAIRQHQGPRRDASLIDQEAFMRAVFPSTEDTQTVTSIFGNRTLYSNDENTGWYKKGGDAERPNSSSRRWDIPARKSSFSSRRAGQRPTQWHSYWTAQDWGQRRACSERLGRRCRTLSKQRPRRKRRLEYFHHERVRLRAHRSGQQTQP